MVHFSEEGVYLGILDWDNSIVVPSRLAEPQLLPTMMEYQNKTGDEASPDVPILAPVLDEPELNSPRRKYLSLF